MDKQTIRQLIRQGLPQAEVTVRGDDGAHFEATVIDDGFAGLSRIARHRAVYATLGDKMGGEIHALSLTTQTKAEAEAAS